MNKHLQLHLIAAIWGSQFFLIETSLNYLNPNQLAFWRSIFGSLILVIISIISKKAFYRYKRNEFFLLILLAITNVVAPFILLSEGQIGVDSNIAAILMALIPFFTLILSIIFLKEKKQKYTFLSILIGLFGIALLIGFDKIFSAEFSLYYELIIILAAFSFSLAIILGKKLENVSSLILSRDLMLLASILLFFIIMIQDFNFSLPQDQEILFTVILLGIFPSGIVYILFFSLIAKSSASFASLSNYLVPLYGVIFGIFLLSEELTITMGIALVLILSSTLLTEKKS